MVRNFTTEDGSAIACGETASENEQLCRRASQRDIWFHLDGQPSPHVVLQVTAKSGAARDSIHDAQQVVKYFSKAREAPSAKVIFIPAKEVSGSKETKTGSVALKKQPTKVSVVYDEGAMTRLLATKK